MNSTVPMDLIIDHSVQVDGWGDMLAFNLNIEKEYERNSERYSLLKWAQGSFRNLRVFPPGKGICHQVNLEYLSTVVALKEHGGRLWRSRTRSSGPTRTPRWSTVWACSAGAWEG